MAYDRSDTDPAKPGRAPAVRYVVASEGDAGQRLDNFLLRELKGVPRTHVYRLLRKGEVRVNSRRARADQRLVTGDRVRLPPVRQPEPAAADRPRNDLQQAVEDAIVYEDADLIAINKPAGLAVHGGSGLAHGVIEALRASRPQLGELDLVHRLDRETSGSLLIAKRRSALRDLHAQLREGRVEKRYLALVCGHWQLGHKRLEVALATDERVRGERHVAVRSHGERAISTFRPLQFFGNVATLMEVELHTGKTHQIRVHAAHAGYPVAGDDKYGDPACNQRLRDLGLHRMFLHSASVGVTRPGSAEPLHISAPLPQDLRAVLDALVREPRSRSPAARRRARSAATR